MIKVKREEGRKPKTINIGKCQDTRRRPIYTTTIFYLSRIRRRVHYLEVYAIALIAIIRYRLIRSIILLYYILGILRRVST
jgi:hypothetical protein